MRASGGELVPARRGQQLAVGAVGLRRHRNAQAVVQRARQPLVGGHVPAADEERGDRTHLRVQPCGHAPLDAAQIRLGCRLVLRCRKQQRDVDWHAGKNRCFYGHHALGRAGNLDVQVRPVGQLVQVHRRRNRTLGIVRQQRRDFQRHPAVHTARGLEHRAKQVGGAAQVGNGQVEEQRFARLALGRAVRDGRVIRVRGADGVLEDGRVRGQPGNRILRDVARQRAAVEQRAGDVVEPETLAQFVKLVRRFHGVSFAGRVGLCQPPCAFISASAAAGPQLPCG